MKLQLTFSVLALALLGVVSATELQEISAPVAESAKLLVKTPQKIRRTVRVREAAPTPPLPTAAPGASVTNEGSTNNIEVKPEIHVAPQPAPAEPQPQAQQQPPIEQLAIVPYEKPSVSAENPKLAIVESGNQNEALVSNSGNQKNFVMTNMGNHENVHIDGVGNTKNLRVTNSGNTELGDVEPASLPQKPAAVSPVAPAPAPVTPLVQVNIRYPLESEAPFVGQAVFAAPSPMQPFGLPFNAQQLGAGYPSNVYQWPLQPRGASFSSRNFGLSAGPLSGPMMMPLPPMAMMMMPPMFGPMMPPMRPRQPQHHHHHHHHHHKRPEKDQEQSKEPEKKEPEKEEPKVEKVVVEKPVIVEEKNIRKRPIRDEEDEIEWETVRVPRRKVKKFKQEPVIVERH